MNNQEIESICTERLGRWQKRLVDEHATPVLLLGVGHDHKSGQTVLCTLEDLTDAELMIFLEGTINILRQQQAAQN